MIQASQKFRLLVILCFCMLLLEALGGRIAPAAEVAVIKVQYRRAAELVEVVQSMLSAEGSVTVSQRTNSLVIVDTPEAIQRVNAYLNQFDRPVEQVRIHVRFHTQTADHQRTIQARGRVSNGDLSVATGGRQRDGPDISLEDRQRRQTGNSEAFVVAMSGSPALIRTGEQIPYRQSSAFFRRHAPRDRTVAWQNAESGFEVTPTVVGENVHLKIVPRITYDDRQDAVIRFFGAQTELTVPIGQWVEIGGAADQQNEVIQEIFSRSQGGQNTFTSMSLMVERR
jgi:type II secretory pathway component GspD/PulD (secretin)